MIFLDAAGLSNPKHEPWIVIAGIIINADKQWKQLAEHLSEMADELAPPEHRAGFAFHATELFSGGRIFPRGKYSKEWRWGVLDRLVAIPKAFHLPIVWGAVRRADLGLGKRFEPPKSTGLEKVPVLHGQILTFLHSSAIAERWMYENADDDEIAQMIMENDNQTRKAFHFIQRILSDPRLNTGFSSDHRRFRLTRIIYPLHFEDKTDSSALQIADVCAFVVKRRCMETPEAERFYQPLMPCLVNALKGDAEAILASRA